MRSREFQDWSRDYEGSGRRSWRDRTSGDEGEDRSYRGRESYEQQYSTGQGGTSDMWDRPRYPRNQEHGERERERERERGYGQNDSWDQRYRSGEHERYGSAPDYARERERRGGYGGASGPDIERGDSYRDRNHRSAQNRDFGYGNRFDRSDRDEEHGYRGYGSGSYGSRGSFGGGAYEGGGDRGYGRDYEAWYGGGGGGMSLDEGRFTTRSQSGQYGGQQHGGQYGGPRRTGNAPKGYKRSDDRIREDVCDRLSERWDVDSQGIEVSVSNGEVTLSGSVPERGMKFRAESISDGVSGVSEVHNQLRVQQHGRQAQGPEQGQEQSRNQGQSEQGQTRESGISAPESLKNHAAHGGKRS